MRKQFGLRLLGGFFSGGFFSGELVCRKFFGSGLFSGGAGLGRLLREPFLFSLLTLRQFFGCALFRRQSGGIFHGGARAPVDFRRRRRCRTARHKGIAQSHRFAGDDLGGRRARRSLVQRSFVMHFAVTGRSRAHGLGRHVAGCFGHIKARRQWRFGVRIRDHLQGSLGHQLPTLIRGAHAEITRGPLHADDTEFLVLAALPVQAADALGGKVGRRIELL